MRRWSKVKFQRSRKQWFDSLSRSPSGSATWPPWLVDVSIKNHYSMCQPPYAPAIMQEYRTSWSIIAHLYACDQKFVKENPIYDTYQPLHCSYHVIVSRDMSPIVRIFGQNDHISGISRETSLMNEVLPDPHHIVDTSKTLWKPILVWCATTRMVRTKRRSAIAMFEKKESWLTLSTQHLVLDNWCR